MALNKVYPYDKNGRPLWLVGNTKAIYDDKGEALDSLLSRISAEASKETFLFSQTGFPDIGDSTCLYCDGTDFYAWDENKQSYRKIISETASSALEKAHTHINKTILDAITKAYTVEESEKLEATTTTANSAIQSAKIGSEKVFKLGTELVLPVYPTRKSLNVDFVDNTHDIDKPISNATKDEFRAVRNELSNEVSRAKEAEVVLTNDISTETARATGVEKVNADNLAAEITRAKAAEKTLTDDLSSETTRAQAAEVTLQDNIDAHTLEVNNGIQALQKADADLDAKKANVVDVNREFGNRYTKSQVYTKEEVLTKIDELIGAAPDTLDTFKEIADALGNDPNFATTIINALSNKVDKVTGKQLSANDYTDSEKNIVADVNSKKHTHGNKTVLDKLTDLLLSNWTDAYNKRHEHGNKSIIDKLTQTMLDNWTAAYTHINDAVKHITSAERNNWNDANSQKHTHSNKSVIDKITQTLLDNWNDSNSKKHSHDNKGVIDKLTQAMLDKLGTVDSGAEANVQSDWSETDTGADSYIKNKPSLFTPESHTHSKSQITDMPSKLSQFTNDKGFITQSDIDTSQNHTHVNKSILDKITQAMLDKLAGIADGANKYVHPNTSGNKHIPSGGISGQILRWSADGTAIWGIDNNTDTKNTAGSTDSSSKLFLIGATSQAANPQTYSQDTAYVGTDGCLYSSGKKVSTIDHNHRKYCMVGSDISGTAGWYKVASQTLSGYGDTNVTFVVTSTYGNYFSGIFQLQMRSDSTSISCKVAKWLARIGFASNSIRIVISGMTWTLYVNQTLQQYGRIVFEVISESSINSINSGITLHSSNTKETTEPVATVTSSDGSTVSYANTSGTATKLSTIRTINGTNFDGTGNIITTKWGTARSLKIGNATKSIDGSANITFTASEIGLPSGEVKLKNITISVSSFSNLVANYSNSSITANQIPDVIFNKTSQTIAAKAGITVSTEAGKLVLTALRLPETDLTIETLILKDAE